MVYYYVKKANDSRVGNYGYGRVGDKGANPASPFYDDEALDGPEEVMHTIIDDDDDFD